MGKFYWTFRNPWQKIAEFDKLRPNYEHDVPEEMMYKIARYRNKRISQTKEQCNIDYMIYHCIVRTKGEITIQECPLTPIDIDRIQNIRKERNTVFFDDGVNRYKFTIPKSTLLKCFDDLEVVRRLPVSILNDPWAPLRKILQ